MKIYGYLYKCEARINKERDGTEMILCWNERLIRPLVYNVELYTNIMKDKDSKHFCCCQMLLKPKDRKRKNNCKIIKYEIEIKKIKQKNNRQGDSQTEKEIDR